MDAAPTNIDKENDAVFLDPETAVAIKEVDEICLRTRSITMAARRSTIAKILQPTRFLDLPGEIRNWIYDYVAEHKFVHDMTSNRTIELIESNIDGWSQRNINNRAVIQDMIFSRNPTPQRPEPSGEPPRKPKQPKTARPPPRYRHADVALLSTCKTVYRELRDLVYARTMFNWTRPLYGRLANSQVDSLPCYEHIRHVSVLLDVVAFNHLRNDHCRATRRRLLDLLVDRFDTVTIYHPHRLPDYMRVGVPNAIGAWPDFDWPGLFPLLQQQWRESRGQGFPRQYRFSKHTVDSTGRVEYVDDLRKTTHWRRLTISTALPPKSRFKEAPVADDEWEGYMLEHARFYQCLPHGMPFEVFMI